MWGRVRDWIVYHVRKESARVGFDGVRVVGLILRAIEFVYLKELRVRVIYTLVPPGQSWV